MKCDEAKPLLDPLLDGYLEPKDMALVLDHIKTCLDCAKIWDDMNKLRNRFINAKVKVAEPPLLLQKISAVIEGEEKRARQKQARKFVPVVIGACVAIIVLGFMAYIGIKTEFHFGLPQPVPVLALIDDVDKENVVTPISGTAELNKALGYELRYINLPDWQLQRASLYGKDKIARMEFISKNDAGSQKLCCYQTWEGHLRIPSQSTAAVVNGKKVQFGEHEGYHFALWSQNGRDYLLVSKLDQPALQNIVSSS
jgi:hypothetical protein